MQWLVLSGDLERIARALVRMRRKQGFVLADGRATTGLKIDGSGSADPRCWGPRLVYGPT